jgi:hypothetical protein
LSKVWKTPIWFERIQIPGVSHVFLELIFWEHLPELLFYLCAKFEVNLNRFASKLTFGGKFWLQKLQSWLKVPSLVLAN